MKELKNVFAQNAPQSLLRRFNKYFKKDERNARTIMDEVLSSLDDANTIVEEVEQMISFVSASGNGNKVPEQAEGDPSLLWPRFCDRLEAIGTVGAVRCYQFNSEKGDPLMSKTTPRPTTEEEVIPSEELN